MLSLKTSSARSSRPATTRPQPMNSTRSAMYGPPPARGPAPRRALSAGPSHLSLSAQGQNRAVSRQITLALAGDTMLGRGVAEALAAGSRARLLDEAVVEAAAR